MRKIIGTTCKLHEVVMFPVCCVRLHDIQLTALEKTLELFGASTVTFGDHDAIGEVGERCELGKASMVPIEDL